MSQKEVGIFIVDFLKYINLVRLEYGAPPLILSNYLCLTAKKRASLLNKEKLSGIKQYFLDITESVVVLDDNILNAESIIGDWLLEAKKYDFNTGKYQAECSRFTSMVWVNAKNFGLGFDYNKKSNKMCIVAQFNPSTNYINQFKQNVLSKGSKVKKRYQNRLLPVAQLPKKDEMEGIFLIYHNKIRKLHDSPKLILNEKLCCLADSCAKSLLEDFIKEKDFYNPHPHLGINVCFTIGGIMSIKDIFNFWCECKTPHDFQLNEFKDNSASFTQIIWRDSELLGIGMATKGIFFSCVALYDPAGNKENMYLKNVLPRIIKKIPLKNANEK